MKKVNLDDVSKTIFVETMKAALSKCDGSIWTLSAKLGLKSNCYSWVNGHMPPYAKMQSVYSKLVDICNDSGK